MIDNPRLDLLVARYGYALVVAFAIVGVLALAASGWAAASPQTTETTQQIGEESIETTVHTSATVVQDGLWDAGTQLEDSPVYVLEDAPELTIEPRTEVTTEGDVSADDASVSHEISIRYEAVRDESVFWDRTEPLTRDEATVSDGVATSSVDLDVEAVLAERRALEDRVAGVGSIGVTLVVETDYDTGTNDGGYAIETPLRVSEEAYWLGETTPVGGADHPEHGTVVHTESRSPVLIGLLALLGSVALGSAWLVSRWSDVDEEAARRAFHERKYAEWISRGSIPMWIGDHHVSLDTLEDVVDVAIDTNERVVHDRQRGLFAVVSDGVVYYYTDRGLWEETAWPSMNLGDHGVGEGPASPGMTPADGRPHDQPETTASSTDAKQASAPDARDDVPPGVGDLPDPDE